MLPNKISISQNREASIKVLGFGVTDYRYIWQLQKGIQKSLINNKGENTLILCQHHTVVTYGKSSNALKNILVSPLMLKSKGIDVLEIERGGDVTLHNPGQLVAYPLLDLKQFKRDVNWYIRSLEQAVILTLSKLGLRTKAIPGKTGVWLERSKVNYKIASIGVRISRWCTMHGVAININNNLNEFHFINPCGFSSSVMTSIKEELQREEVDIKQVEDIFIDAFSSVFNAEMYYGKVYN